MGHNKVVGTLSVHLYAGLEGADPAPLGKVSVPLVASGHTLLADVGGVVEYVGESMKAVFGEGGSPRDTPPGPERAERLCYGFGHVVSGVAGGGQGAHDADSFDLGRETLEDLRPINVEDVVRLASHVAEEYVHVGAQDPDGREPVVLVRREDGDWYPVNRRLTEDETREVADALVSGTAMTQGRRNELAARLLPGATPEYVDLMYSAWLESDGARVDVVVKNNTFGKRVADPEAPSRAQVIRDAVDAWDPSHEVLTGPAAEALSTKVETALTRAAQAYALPEPRTEGWVRVSEDRLEALRGLATADENVYMLVARAVDGLLAGEGDRG
jgi:hypothetical protein